MFIGGDALIERWLDLLVKVRVHDLEIGHALKRSFYINWIAPRKMPQPSDFHFIHRLFNTLSLPLSVHMVNHQVANTDVLFLRAGHTDRELLNVQGVFDQLKELNIATVTPWLHRLRQYQSMLWIIKAHTRYKSMVKNEMNCLQTFSAVLPEIRRNFDLPDYFDLWFWQETELVIWRYVVARDVIKSINPHVLVSVGDNLPVGYIFHHAARQAGVNSVVIQHGFISQTWLHFPVWSNKICVWGENEKQWYIDHSVPEHKIVVTGNPRAITDLPIQDRVSIRNRLGCVPKERLVVWFTTYRRDEWITSFVEWLNHPSIASLDVKIILKLHPIESKSLFQGKIPSHIRIFAANELDNKSAFTAADVIVHDHSSVGAEAQYCGQNVICAAIQPPYPDFFHLLTDGQVYVEKPEALATAIQNFTQPNLHIKESRSMKFGGEKSSESIANVIRSLISN